MDVKFEKIHGEFGQIRARKEIETISQMIFTDVRRRRSQLLTVLYVGVKEHVEIGHFLKKVWQHHFYRN